MRGILNRQPVALISCLFVAIVFGFAVIIRHQTGGMFVYPLDDTYIHLALARTLVLHHVWGIDGRAFASASSSPGWTIVLSAWSLLFGQHLLNALLANLLVGIAVLFAVDYGLRTLVPACGLWVRYLVLLVVLLGTPLPNLALLGMEHMAQTLTALLFALFSVQILEVKPGLPIPRGIMLCLLAASIAAGAIRYEAVFMVAPVCLCLLLRRRLALAILVGLCSAAAPVLFGVYFHHMSGLWLPFSVIVKAAESKPVGMSFLATAIANTDNAWFRPVLLFLGLVWLIRLRRFRLLWPSQLLLLLTFWICLLHLVFAPVGWMMRYESYLFALALFSLGVCLAELVAQKNFSEVLSQRSILLWLEICLIGLFAFRAAEPVWQRITKGLELPAEASVDRYHEHIQMAKFVSREYNHDTVVLNDIGAVAYYSDAHLLDMIGLGSAKPAITIHDKHRFTAADMENWAASEHASIAIVQSQWPTAAVLLPPAWIKVETWTMPRNVVFHDYDISFYAVDPIQIPRLCASLRRYSAPPQDKITVYSPACQADSPTQQE